MKLDFDAHVGELVQLMDGSWSVCERAPGCISSHYKRLSFSDAVKFAISLGVAHVCIHEYNSKNVTSEYIRADDGESLAIAVLQYS